MPEYKILEIKQSIFADNDADADRLREELKEKGIFENHNQMHRFCNRICDAF